MSDRLIDAYRANRARASGRRNRGFIESLVAWDQRELASLERRILSIDRRQGRRAITNAHKATHNLLADEARRNIAAVPMQPSRSKSARRLMTLDRFEQSRKNAGRSKGNTKPFRRGVQQKGSWQFRATFNRSGVVSRSWISSKFYNRFIGHFFERGYRPGGKGSKVRGTSWRFGPARRPNANKKFARRCLRALQMQIDAGKTMTAKELERVI